MFTGLVEGTGLVPAAPEPQPDGGARLRLDAPWLAPELGTGDSVAVNGCCLTVTAHDETGFRVDMVPETLRRTALGGLRPGSRVNLERPVAVGDRLGGHIVQGHVDGLAEIIAITPAGDAVELRARLDPALARYVVSKGSVALDGVSLTVADCGPDWLTIALIPHTLVATTFGDRVPGDQLQVEVDVVAKYVERLVAPHAGTTLPPLSDLPAHPGGTA